MPSLSDASPYVFGILILAISLGAMLTGVYVMFTYHLMQKIYDDSKKDRDLAGEVLETAESDLKRLKSVLP